MSLKCRWIQALSSLTTFITDVGFNEKMQKWETKTGSHIHRIETWGSISSFFIPSYFIQFRRSDQRRFKNLHGGRPTTPVQDPSTVISVTCSTSGRHPASSTGIVPGNERKKKTSVVVGTRETAARGHSFPSRLPTSWTSIHYLPFSSTHYSFVHRLTSITGPPGVSAFKLRAALHLEAGPIPLEADWMKFQPFLVWRQVSTTHYSKIIKGVNFLICKGIRAKKLRRFNKSSIIQRI
jgi:hypothetical protein